jgi:hypothetical protein
MTGAIMPLADRRSASRVEIIGKPWGTLETLEPLRVRNLSREGMLLESATPLAVGSVHVFQVVDGTVTARIRAAVRHVSPVRQAGGGGQWYLTGLEFLSLDIEAAAGIERMLREHPAPLNSNGA